MGEHMNAEEEVLRTLEALKSAGFKPVDAVFKGMIAVMRKSTLHMIQELADAQEAVGSIVILYKNPDGELRSVEIPVGKVAEGESVGGDGAES